LIEYYLKKTGPPANDKELLRMALEEQKKNWLTPMKERSFSIRAGEALLKSVTDANTPTALSLLKLGDTIDVNYYKPLIEAIRANNLTLVNALLTRPDINIEVRDSYGNTPLEIAYMFGNATIALALLDNDRVNINIRDNIWGKVGIGCYQKFSKNEDIVGALLRKGFNPQAESGAVEALNRLLQQQGGKRSRTQRKSKCRLVVGKRETCCIKPRKGHWCWSKGTKRRISRKMKRNCCK
jgi:hypothetical protein